MVFFPFTLTVLRDGDVTQFTFYSNFGENINENSNDKNKKMKFNEEKKKN